MPLTNHFKSFLFFFLLSIIGQLKAQDTSKFYIFSGVGVINGLGTFGKSVKPSLGFNSGLELKFKKQFFVQFSLDFNSLKYNQQNIDANSQYLFQNTSSNLLMLGLNLGYNFNKINSKWLISSYLGSGFINIGEPRIQLTNPNTIMQSVVNKSNIFGRGGIRIGYKTSSAFFQTLYTELDYWTSSTIVQGGNVSGIAILLGTRITM